MDFIEGLLILSSLCFYIKAFFISLRYIVARYYKKNGTNEHKLNKANSIINNTTIKKDIIIGTACFLIALAITDIELVFWMLLSVSLICILFLFPLRYWFAYFYKRYCKNEEKCIKANNLITNPKMKILGIVGAVIYFPITFYVLIVILLKGQSNVLEKSKNNYYRSTYYNQTGNKYHNIAINNNTGKLGEYRIYIELKYLEENGAKFLFNTYIPKDDNQTTEIDVILLCTKGIFVFESKDYSGWIFGNPNEKMWTQTLPAGKGQSYKSEFYNPLMQNDTHIKCLKKIFTQEYPIFSYVVFSNRCELKNFNHSHIIYRSGLKHAIETHFMNNPTDVLTQEEIEVLYKILYPYTQVDETVKEQHINQFK